MILSRRRARGAPSPRPVRFLLRCPAMRAHPKLVTMALVCALQLSCLVGPASASWRTDVDSLHAAAERSFTAGEYRRAAALYARTAETIAANNGTTDVYLSNMAARSRFLEGRSLESLKRWDEASAAYGNALVALPVISDAIRVRLARCRLESGDLEAAVSTLREVLSDGVTTSFDLQALESLGDAYLDAGDATSALRWYEEMLEAAADGDLAKALYKIGLAHEELGETDRALERYATAVTAHPSTAGARDALKRGRAVSRSFTDRYHQGLVAYHDGRLRDAAEFFTHYLKHDAGEFAAQAAYHLGRCQQRQGNFRGAAREYERAVELGAEGGYADLAWSKLAFCLRRLGRIDESVAAYDRYAALYADRIGTAHILWEKARLLEEEQRWDEARDAFSALADRYPSSERAGDALFRAGLCLYKLGKYREAAADFATLYASSTGARAARALYWVGKVDERFGRIDSAIERYREAAGAARDSFYGRRALERLAFLEDGRPEPATSPQPATLASRPPGLPWSQERRDFAAWLAEWHERVYVPGVSAAMRERLSEDPTFVRADHFLCLHMPGPAAAELSKLEAGFASDPRMLDVLIGYYERNGFHRRAIRFAERMLRLSPADEISDAPVYLRRKICPAHWRDVVVRECAKRGVDPSLFFSLIRQESLFESVARSGPGARGLSQIMPETGKWIARRLGHRGFAVSRLNDPETNIEFGAYYLSQQLADFDGDVLRALAAYNGGPGNVKRWWNYGGTGDSDVFFEDIGFAETRDYVERVYRYSGIYREIYGGFGN